MLGLGARFEEDELAGHSRVSPRLSAGLLVGQRSSLTLALGRTTQALRSYELQVGDGVEVIPAWESAVEVALYGRHLGTPGQLRWELFQRRIENPQPQFFNLLDPFSTVPELETDRIRLDADRSTILGARVDYRRQIGERARVWASAASTKARDRVDGRDRRRSTDVPHELKVGGQFGWASGWRLSGEWRMGSGRPVTSVGLGPDGDLALGEALAERLPGSSQLDLSVERGFDLSIGRLDLQLTVENVLGQRAVRGYSYVIENERLERHDLRWAGALPSFRFRLRL